MMQESLRKEDLIKEASYTEDKTPMIMKNMLYVNNGCKATVGGQRNRGR